MVALGVSISLMVPDTLILFAILGGIDMQIKIAMDKLTVVKSSLNPIEKNCFEKVDFGVGAVAGFLGVRETQYTYEISGMQTTLYELLYKLSVHFDIELM